MDIIPSVPAKGFSIFLIVFALVCVALAATLPEAAIHLVILAIITLSLAYLMHVLI